ncbi:hypothetical protein MNV49_001157 [Pseudohyphozyma bogoriensis]|nr:hypothetical protein MNV49_001157 [Pseudohyphozyma bogoriensis]
MGVLDKLTSKLGATKIEDEHDDEVPSSDDEAGGSAVDDKKQHRTYTIRLVNKSGCSVQMTTWPVKASTHSDYMLNTHRGADFRETVPPAGTSSIDESFVLGAMRGPKPLDPRHRWGWVYFDLVRSDRKKVHLQVFVRADRKGVDLALLGRTDLDSNFDNPMSSGELGKGVWDEERREVVFELGEELADVENTVDDSTKKASRLLAGKGVHTATYVSDELGRASIIVGHEARYHEYAPPEPPSRFSTIKHSIHEVEGIASRYVGAFVERNGKSWWNGSVKVDPVTGIARGKGFNSTAETVAVFGEDGSVVNYGFHDAGHSRADQVYAYVTPSHANWLGDLIASDPRYLSLPFSRLALAAAHDSGMFGQLDAGLATLIQEGHLGSLLESTLETKIAHPTVKFVVQALELVKLSPARVINNIALTQKDSFADQLKIGVRFFDFRPGFCFHNVINLKKGRMHHQHAMVPGCLYVVFLADVLNFLSSHPKEIVVVELKSDGFVVREDKVRNGQVAVYSMIPSEEELAQVLEEARQNTDDGGRSVVIGGAQDLDSPIGTLIEQNKRFIIIGKVHHPDAWPRADSYDHVSYNTENPATILASLEETFKTSSHPEDKREGVPSRGAIYQLQATPTANIRDDIGASLTYSDSSSLLTYMKPQQDRATYPWIASHTFEDPGNVIFLNDFVDGALVEHAIEVSKQRSGF